MGPLVGILAVGASITAGIGAGGGPAWPELLQSAFSRAGIKGEVYNAGVPGNRLLVGSSNNPSALDRVDFLIASHPRLSWVVFADDPLNDIGGSTKTVPSPTELIAGLRALANKVRSRGVRFACATLTPFEGAVYWSSSGERVRKAYNYSLREQRCCDTVIDLDETVSDPLEPDRIRPGFDSGDHLHSNFRGQQAIAVKVFHALQNEGF